MIRQLFPQRLRSSLTLKVASLFVLVTSLGILLTGILYYRYQTRNVEKTLGTFLLHIARTGALLIDGDLHRQVQQATRREGRDLALEELPPQVRRQLQDVKNTPAYQDLRHILRQIQRSNDLADPVYTLTDMKGQMARFMVISEGPTFPGEPYRLAPAIVPKLRQTLEEGLPTYTRIYTNEHGMWITAFAPVRDGEGRMVAALDVDFRVRVYLDEVKAVRRKFLGFSALAAVVSLVLGIFFSRQITGPVKVLTRGARRVMDGDLSQRLPVRSTDEVGQLTQAFNEMVEGLRQRDFIRDTFGRYVSPEVASAILESPEGFSLGGEKRQVTVLMSDLRGFTGFSERADPPRVMQVLNAYLARMADIVIEHRGTINEYIGDAIFAVFGAPIPFPDHAERAVTCALAMQVAMQELTRDPNAKGIAELGMGIGINTGEALVGNIGSEKRTKYAVVGHAVNLAARVESCTVGGQILLSASTYALVRDFVETEPPITVEMKGLHEPLVLYELRGRTGLDLPAIGGEEESLMPVLLPVEGWVVEGKLVRPEVLTGKITRLGRRGAEAQFTTLVPPLTNLKLRLRFVESGRLSGDIYAKVLRTPQSGNTGVFRLGFTFIDAADQALLEEFRQKAWGVDDARATGEDPRPGSG